MHGCVLHSFQLFIPQLIDDAPFAWAICFLILRCLSVVSFCGPAGSQDCSAVSLTALLQTSEGGGREPSQHRSIQDRDPAYYYSYCPSLLAAIDELNRLELISANTRMSRILQAWIISAALLSASVVATRTRQDEEVDDENNEAVVPIQIAPHPQRPMQFVTTDEVMNRFGDNSRLEGLRGSSSSPPSLLSSSLPQHYIINGQTAAAGRYTWFAQAYTKVNGGFYLGGCGAVLIAREWIATAAHCVDGAIQPTHFEVGTYCPPPYSFGVNCDQEREFGKVKRSYLHEEWGISIDGGPINDIALFQLEDPIESVEPIEMDTGAMDLSHGSDLKAIGIGVTNQMTGERASVLQEVGMRYVSKDQCKLLFRGAFRESHMICAFEENKGTCSGDSGTIVSA